MKHKRQHFPIRQDSSAGSIGQIKIGGDIGDCLPANAWDRSILGTGSSPTHRPMANRGFGLKSRWGENDQMQSTLVRHDFFAVDLTGKFGRRQREVGEMTRRHSDSFVRERLLSIARKISDPKSFPPDEDYDSLIDEWDRLCPHPGGTNIIFWPNVVGLCRDEEVGSFRISPEAMVEFAMSWEPRVVAMRIKQRSGGESVGFYIYHLEAPDTPNTQIATSLENKFEKGTVVNVALKGAELPNGTLVEPSFEYRVFSCGRILGATSSQLGARLDSFAAEGGQGQRT